MAFPEETLARAAVIAKTGVPALALLRKAEFPHCIRVRWALIDTTAARGDITRGSSINVKTVDGKF